MTKKRALTPHSSELRDAASASAKQSEALVLVASSNPAFWQRARAALGPQYAVAFAADLPGVLDLLKRHRPPLVVLYAGLLDEQLAPTIRRIRREDSDARVILVTTHSQDGAAPDPAMALADACLDQQLAPRSLASVARGLLAADRSGPSRSPAPTGKAPPDIGPQGMVTGNSPAFRRVLEMVQRVAAVDVPIVIYGESGTGKELMARWIHDRSHRNGGPFVAVDLPAIPDDLFESRLFGHERGAFTGAVGPSPGRFQQADGGTLFLDELSCLKPELQPKLLRALQEGLVERVGGREPVSCDTRVLAATNIDLAAAVRAGDFRMDLFHRLTVISITLPPLRERLEDLPDLVGFFLRKHAARFGRQVPRVPDTVLEAMERHPWPGNIRELENCVQRALLLAGSDCLSLDDLGWEQHGLQGLDQEQQDVDFGDCRHSLAELESLYIDWVIRKTEGNQTQAAQLLQIDRKTLRSKLQKISGLQSENGKARNAVA
jgi:DNA-binding NtrC family response regulator